MKVAYVAFCAFMAISCYQTSTSNDRTVRTNTVTGRSERLSGGKWVPIAEATPTARPLSATECEERKRRHNETGKGLSPETMRMLGICP